LQRSFLMSVKVRKSDLRVPLRQPSRHSAS
jgi:hypothetical protein